MTAKVLAKTLDLGRKDTKICPLMSGSITSEYIYCHKENCGWWNSRWEECSVYVISAELSLRRLEQEAEIEREEILTERLGWKR